MKPLLNRRSWNTLFSAASDEKCSGHLTPLVTASCALQLSDFMNVRGAKVGHLKSCYVQVRENIIKEILDTSTFVVSGRVHWNAIVFDKTVDIYIRYDQILASRLIASIRRTTLPKDFFDECEWTPNNPQSRQVDAVRHDQRDLTRLQSLRRHKKRVPVKGTRAA